MSRNLTNYSYSSSFPEKAGKNLLFQGLESLFQFTLRVDHRNHFINKLEKKIMRDGRGWGKETLLALFFVQDHFTSFAFPVCLGMAGGGLSHIFHSSVSGNPTQLHTWFQIQNNLMIKVDFPLAVVSYLSSPSGTL